MRTEDQIDDEEQSGWMQEATGEGRPVDAPKARKFSHSELDAMSTDEVRGVATALDVHECGTFTDKAELIREILRRT